MFAVRRLLLHPRLAAALCVAALLLKLLVPAGYMVGSEQGRIGITLCGVALPAPAHAMPAMHGGTNHGHDRSGKHGKLEMPCAFAGLSALALGAVDPILLAALLAFVMAHGLTGTCRPAPPCAPYLQPPSQGPPPRL